VAHVCSRVSSHLGSRIGVSSDSEQVPLPDALSSYENSVSDPTGQRDSVRRSGPSEARSSPVAKLACQTRKANLLYSPLDYNSITTIRRHGQEPCHVCALSWADEEDAQMDRRQCQALCLWVWRLASATPPHSLIHALMIVILMCPARAGERPPHV